jgi:transposase
VPTPRTTLMERARHAVEDVVKGGKCFTSEDVRKLLREKHGVHASKRTVLKALRKERISRRSVYPVHKINVGNQDLRDTFTGHWSKQTLKDWNDVISIDEAGIYINRSSQKLYYPKGPRLHVHNPTGVRNRTKLTLVMAVSTRGIVHAKVMEKNCNKVLFGEFIRELAEKRSGEGGARLLMDNVAFHKSKETKDVYKECNFEPFFVPPYTSEYNPIERVFHMIKSRFRKLMDVDSDVPKSIQALSEIIHDVSSNHAKCLRNIYRRVYRQVVENKPLGYKSVML